MAYKSQPSFRHLPTEGWLQQHGETPGIELKQMVEMTPSPRTPKEAGALPVLDVHLLYSPTLREMLESGNYRVALVPRSDWDTIQGPREGTFSPATPALLLPLSWNELVASVPRNDHIFTEAGVARFEDVRVDFSKMEVRRSSGELITLTTQEFKTLRCFLLNPDRVFSREELLNEAWGYENYPCSRTVDNHVLRLRQKIEKDPAHPVHFRTVHGAGYKFVP